MNVTGVDAVTYGVRDVAEAKRFLEEVQAGEKRVLLAGGCRSRMHLRCCRSIRYRGTKWPGVWRAYSFFEGS